MLSSSKCLCNLSRQSWSSVRSYCQSPNSVNRNLNVLNLSENAAKTTKVSRAKRIHWTFGSAAMLVLPAFTFCLGCWQVQRLQWKLDLVEQLKTRLLSNSEDFPINDLHLLDEMEYRRLRLSGRFLHDQEFIISPRGRFDPGYSSKDSGSLLSDNNMSSHGGHVITPFRVANSDLVVLINRGWVPAHLFSPNSRPRDDMITTIEAICRKSEKRPQFVQQNMPEQGIWFYKDFEQMAKQYNTAPIYLEQAYDASAKGFPIAGQTNINIRNDHLSYLTTWFTLTAVTLGMWIVRFRK